MTKRKLKAAGVLLTAAALLLGGCGGADQSSVMIRSATREEAIPSLDTGRKLDKVNETAYTYAAIAESDVLRLSYDEVNNCFQIEDKRSGKVWDTIVNAAEKGIKVNELWNQNLSSLFYVTYSVKSSNGQMKSTTVPLRKLEPVIWTEAIADGLRIQYYMPTVKLGFQAEFTLDEDTLQVHIPAESVREDGTVLFVRLDVMPLLGASDIGADGYYLLPDGSGTLFQLDSARYDTSYRFDAYSSLTLGNDFPDKLDRSKDVVATGSQNSFSAPLPVYGVRLGTGGFIAYPTAGDSNYSINAATGSTSVRINKIYGQFVMRHVYSFSTSALTAGEDSSMIYETTDEFFVDIDRTLRYTFLNGEEAAYSGMADAYRGALREQGILGDPLPAGSVPVVLDFFMGVKETGIMSGNFMTMTSFDDVLEILEELRGAGAANLMVNLRGWNKEGYGAFSKTFPPDSRLGGKAGLKALIAYCDENGIALTLETDFVNVTKAYASSEIQSGLVKNMMGQVVSSTDGAMVLLNPRSALLQFEAFLKKAGDFDVPGVCLPGVGERIYPDYRQGKSLYRADTITAWQSLLQKAKASFDTVLVPGGNLYALPYASLVTELPGEVNYAAISDESVPFLQMVLHGYIPYASSSFNSFYDTGRQTLKNLEYGALPLFELTREPVRNLKNTAYNKLFSASFGEWKEEILKTYSMVNGDLAAIYSAPITGREELVGGVVRMRYAGGLQLLLNYGETDALVDGRTVGAGDYLLVREA